MIGRYLSLHTNIYLTSDGWWKQDITWQCLYAVFAAGGRVEAVPHQLLPGGLARHRQRAGRGGGHLHHQLLRRDTGQPTGMSHHVADVDTQRRLSSRNRRLLLVLYTFVMHVWINPIFWGSRGAIPQFHTITIIESDTEKGRSDTHPIADWRHPGADQLQPAGPPLRGEQLLGPVGVLIGGRIMGRVGGGAGDGNYINTPHLVAAVTGLHPPLSSRPILRTSGDFRCVSPRLAARRCTGGRCQVT